jgi:hypothetical protein
MTQILYLQTEQGYAQVDVDDAGDFVVTYGLQAERTQKVSNAAVVFSAFNEKDEHHETRSAAISRALQLMGVLV